MSLTATVLPCAVDGGVAVQLLPDTVHVCAADVQFRGGAQVPVAVAVPFEHITLALPIGLPTVSCTFAVLPSAPPG